MVVNEAATKTGTRQMKTNETTRTTTKRGMARKEQGDSHMSNPNPEVRLSWCEEAREGDIRRGRERREVRREGLKGEGGDEREREGEM